MIEQLLGQSRTAALGTIGATHSTAGVNTRSGYHAALEILRSAAVGVFRASAVHIGVTRDFACAVRRTDFIARDIWIRIFARSKEFSRYRTGLGFRLFVTVLIGVARVIAKTRHHSTLSAKAEVAACAVRAVLPGTQTISICFTTVNAGFRRDHTLITKTGGVRRDAFSVAVAFVESFARCFDAGASRAGIMGWAGAGARSWSASPTSRNRRGRLSRTRTLHCRIALTRWINIICGEIRSKVCQRTTLLGAYEFTKCLASCRSNHSVSACSRWILSFALRTDVA